jgi:hypothetical protein
MHVTRGDLSPDQVGHARRREIEEVRNTQETRRGSPPEPPPAPESTAVNPGVRQQVLLAQRQVARAQSVLAGLEGFRDFLLLNGGVAGGTETAAAMRRATYHGEQVLEPHRDMLVGIAGRGDLPALERLIASVRQTVASLVPGSAGGEPTQAALQGVLAGIREASGTLAVLDRTNVLKLLS